MNDSFFVFKSHLKIYVIFYSVFLCSICFRAIDRRNRFPKKNVIMASGMRRRSVSNMFNFNQKRPNNVRILPKHAKNPIPLKLNEKFDKLIPSFAHRMSNTTSGTAHRTVNTSDTRRGGRFSGSRN